MINDIVRCNYCAGDWHTHDANGRRFCNTQLNKVKRIAADIEARDNDPEIDEAIVVKRTAMKITSRPKRFD